MIVRLENSCTIKCFEGDGDFIDELKKLSLPEEIIRYRLFNDICKIIEKSGYEQITKFVPNPDYIVFVKKSSPVIDVISQNDVQSIFVGTITGNCIDRFMAHNMNTFISRVTKWSDDINSRNNMRENANDYHNTSMFESDFKELTELKRICETMASKIGKFQENITLGYK